MQLSGSARTAGSVVVFATLADPIGFRMSTRDVEAHIAAKEHTSEARGDDRGPLLFTQDTCIVQVTLLVQIEHSYEK